MQQWRWEFEMLPSKYSMCSLLSWYLELMINRQNSNESISSLTSTTSHSSMGSLKEQEAKKKKKKSWVRTHRQNKVVTLIRNIVKCIRFVSHWQISLCILKSHQQSRHTVLCGQTQINSNNYFAVVNESDVFFRSSEKGMKATLCLS